MEYVLTTEALCKSYRHFKALDGFAMHVPRGSVYGFVGRNGAGKTTLIRLICGLQRPTGGAYVLYGKRHTEKEIAQARRRMAAIVETPAIYLNMTARDNLRQQYHMLGLPSFEGMDEILELVGLSDAAGKRAGKFSLGMKQRLGIAVALVGDPDFLVLDEPMNGLDPQGIVEIRELILRLNRERQITVLISSHILDELSRVATYYGFIDSGRMVKEISADEMERELCRCTRMTVSDTRILARVLDGMRVNYKILSDTEAEVYGNINVTQFVVALSTQGCEIFAMQEHEASLESYYMKLVGGREPQGGPGRLSGGPADPGRCSRGGGRP